MWCIHKLKGSPRRAVHLQDPSEHDDLADKCQCAHSSLKAWLSKHRFCSQNKVSSYSKSRRSHGEGHRVLPVCFTLGKTPCQQKSNHELGNWYLAFNTRAKTSTCRQRPLKILSPRQDCREEDGACFWGKVKKNHHHQPQKHVTLYSWVRKLTTSTDTERYDIFWESDPAGGKAV